MGVNGSINLPVVAPGWSVGWHWVSFHVHRAQSEHEAYAIYNGINGGASRMLIAPQGHVVQMWLGDPHWFNLTQQQVTGDRQLWVVQRQQAAEAAQVAAQQAAEAARVAAQRAAEAAQVAAQQAEVRRQQEIEANRLRQLATAESARLAAMNAEKQRLQAKLQARVDVLNALRIPVGSSKSVVLVGLKGTGKSTLLYLLGSPNKPAPPAGGGDGTVHLDVASLPQLPGMVDCIGMLSWNEEDLLKLIVVVLMHGGLPADLIIFCNADRIAAPLSHLAKLGITNPMLVSMHSDVWEKMEPKDDEPPLFELKQDEATKVRRIVPEARLGKMYSLRSYQAITTKGIAVHPITHHDDLPGILASRRAAGISPFGHLQDLLSRNASSGHIVFRADEQDKTSIAIANLLYSYVNVYNKNPLEFINNATLAACEIS